MALLVGLAIVPLLGVTFFVVEEYRAVESGRDLVEGIDASMDELATLDALRLAIIDEGNWVTSRRGVAELGVAVGLVTSLTGVDLDVELESARDRVDEALAQPVAQPYRTDALRLRGDDTDELTELNNRYGELEAEIGATTDELRRQLLSTVTSVPDGGQIIDAIRSEEAATRARLFLSQLVWSYFRSEFSPLLEAAPDFAAMVRQQDEIDESVALIASLGGSDDSLVIAALDARQNRDTVELMSAVEDSIRQSLDPDSQSAEDDVDIFTTISEGARVFRSGVDAMPAFDLVAEQAGRRVQATGEASADAAGTEFAIRLAVLGAIALISISVAVALARYVGRPMVELGEAAVSLGDGTAIDLKRSGPAEVRAVSDALGTAAAGLALVERLEHLATHDDLTGIPGRRHALHRLEQARARASRDGTRGAFMFIDLDDFKIINDTYGHPAGDVVLQSVATRVRDVIGPENEVGRYGGDEFVVIADSLWTDDAAADMADRIVDALAAPIDASDATDRAPVGGLVVSASVGVTTFGADDPTSDEIIRRADAAVYEAKDAGRARAILHTAAAAV